jgi:two-component system OmpR family sensor kinase
MKPPEAEPTRRPRPFLLSPQRWPVRWRLAGVSAALTLIILLAFAVVVGRLATARLKSDFNEDLKGTAVSIASSAQVAFNPTIGTREIHIPPQQLQNMAPVPNSALRIVYSDGDLVSPTSRTAGAPDFGPPDIQTVQEFGDYGVAAQPLAATLSSENPVYIEYARNRSGLDETINHLWLFLGLGVLGGTLLATLAGLAVAGRAMRPIVALTGTAREIASTRDPSKRVPLPQTDDEIAELAQTLDQMLRELDAARAETETMIQTQREFVADASHELRTPLTSILANLELLQDQVERAGDAGEEGEIVASALRSSRRMRRLVADLLLLARADAGRTGARSPVDLTEIAAAAVDEVRPVANGHHLELHTGDPIQIEGNADELHRLALNLLDNSLRHTPPGSEIDIAVRRRNGDAVLEVSDDGPGLPEGMEEHLFSRFVRGDGPADVSVDSGAGLGLAIVKAVANSHGGDVEAGRSQAGGARFTVTLPLGNGPANS